MHGSPFENVETGRSLSNQELFPKLPHAPTRRFKLKYLESICTQILYNYEQV